MADDVESIISVAHRNLSLFRGPIEKHEKYYNGTKRLSAMGLSVPPELEYLQTVVNWPRLAVDSLEERLKLFGFRAGDSADIDARAAQWMKSNHFSINAPAAHTEALIQGIGYLSVDWDGNANHDPVILPEAAGTFWVSWDATRRNIRSAVRFWNDPFLLEPQARTIEEMQEPSQCTVYLPNSNVYFTKDRGQWVQTDEIVHNLNRVTIVPMVNRRRVQLDRGESEMTDVIPITDAATRALTDLQMAQELYAMPKIWLLGADSSAFQDANGNAIPKWEMYLNAINAVTSQDAKVQQTQAGQLSNYSNVISTYSKLAASVTGIPAYYFGDAGDSNPIAEGSITASENRHVIKAERRQDSFGDAWCEALSIASQMVDKSDTGEDYTAVWRDAATPTFASKAVVVNQMFVSGLYSRRSALTELDMTPSFIADNEADFANDVNSNILNQLGIGGVSNSSGTGGGVGNQPGTNPNVSSNPESTNATVQP